MHARQVSELWTQATEVEKAPYNALASIDFVRYQSELEAYNYRCRNVPTCSGCCLCCGKVLKTFMLVICQNSSGRLP